ncbi:MAG TPA: hypothetical protein VGO50_21345 [Pyrinomonadaceae bacterium]|jgi:peptidoglycan hydrolase CwlO-like protein|nr:hypothetical protein [Pyrinomonadaceae bacterium]
MKKFVIALLLMVITASIFACGGAGAPGGAANQNANRAFNSTGNAALDAELQKIREDSERLKKELEKMQKKVEQAKPELDNLNKQIEKTGKEIQETNRRIQKLK